MEFKLFKRYLQFINLINERHDGQKNYIKFQQFQAAWILDYLSNEIDLENSVVLDIGVGLGGYTEEIARNSGFVYAFDLNVHRKIQMNNILQVKGDAIFLPFKNNSFDFIFCASLIEHIKNQQRILGEIFRVLKVDPSCYLSFPPFYSPMGGHQFKPFHLFGEKIAITLSKRFKEIDVKDFETSFGNWGLYPTTISRVMKLLITETGFEIDKISTRFSPINFAKIPIFREFLTWHVEFLIRKRSDKN